MDALNVALAAETWLEEHFWASEPFIANEDLAPVRHFVVHLASVRLLRFLKSALEIGNNVRHRLFDVLDDVRLRLCVEREAALLKDLTHVVG